MASDVTCFGNRLSVALLYRHTLTSRDQEKDIFAASATHTFARGQPPSNGTGVHIHLDLERQREHVHFTCRSSLGMPQARWERL